MTLTITKGMDGKTVKTIGKYSIEEIDKMHADFFEWKKNEAPKKYRVTSYERNLINDESHKIIIDFGDYSYFGRIKTTKAEWKPFIEHKMKPVDLEV